jgi:UDP-GlcNAc:undecaprenyl-phosphate GlcNAc-1-phosphate transferase
MTVEMQVATGVAAPDGLIFSFVVAPFVVALVASFGAAWWLARRSARFAPRDAPGGRKLHGQPIPLVGGVALLIGTAAGAWVIGRLRGRLELDSSERRLLLAPLLCFAVGLYDDFRGKRLSALMKAAGTAVALLVARPLVTPWLEWLPWVPVAFVAVHAMNTIDHANGIAGLVAAIGGLAVAAAAAWHGWSTVRFQDLVALAVAGAAVGFLFLNFPRARVFLGDSGTLLLGGALAALLLERRRPELLLLAAVPIADLASVAFLRIRAGARPWVGDRRHVTHRLVARGVGETKAVLLLAAVQACCSAAAAVALAQPEEPTFAWTLTIGVIAALALGMLCVKPVARMPFAA